MFCKDCLKHAYNAAFEWYCLCRHFKHLPFDAGWLTEWRDTMLHGLYCGYTAGLAATGEALGLPQDKRKLSAGSALIRTFCVPRKPTARNPSTRVRPAAEPEKWRLFKEYNAQDVVTEQEIERRLSVWPVPDAVQKQWETDILINARGVAVDLDLVHGALSCSARVTQELTQEAVQISGLDNPNSVAQLSRWLEDETGAEVADLRKDTVARMLADGAPSEAVQRMLEIRQELGKTSNKKYAAMDAGAGEGGRVRGLLQFYGANRTGRWAGRLVQVQNLPRTHLPGIELARERVKAEDVDTLRMLYGSVPDTLSQLIRTALVPAPGHRFVDADFSAIEARVIAWLSGEEWVLDVFRTHGKIYEATASQMFGVPLERIKKGNPEYDLRQKGKVATLALGYQGGVGALINMGALSMGIPEDELPGIVAALAAGKPAHRGFLVRGGGRCNRCGPHRTAAGCGAPALCTAGRCGYRAVVFNGNAAQRARAVLRKAVPCAECQRIRTAALLRNEPDLKEMGRAGDLRRQAGGEHHPGRGAGLPGGEHRAAGSGGIPCGIPCAR